MDEFNKETSGLKLRAWAEQIRLLSERIDQAHKTSPDQLFALFDELIGCYREDRNSSPEPSDEVIHSVAKSLMRVFSYIRASSDIAAFEKYSSMFDELEPTLQNPLEKARIFQTFGFLFWLKNDMDESIRYLKESLKILNDNEIDDDIPERYTNLGYVYEYLGDYRKAEKIYQEGLNYAKKHNYEAALIQAYSGMGRLNLRLKRYKTAIKYLERNLDLVDDKAQIVERATIITNLAHAYLNLGQIDKALDLNLQLDNANLEQLDPELHSSIILNIGCCYYDQKNYNNAKPYFLKALDYARTHNDAPQLIFALINLGKVSRQENDLNTALDQFKTALELVEQTHNLEQLAIVNEQLGEVYLGLEDYHSALAGFEQAIACAQDTGVSNFAGNPYARAAVCSEKLGNFEQAYRYLAQSLELRSEGEDQQDTADDEIKTRRVISSGRKSHYLFSGGISLISKELSAKIGFSLIGNSKEMQDVVEKAYIAAKNDAVNVMLYGESGTGKELIARLIHHSSRRSDKPFVEVNSAVFTTSLAESSLFGHKKGAFTGASEAHLGCFQTAHNGTLFLDEISEMPPTIQSMLLRVLEAKQIRPLGSNATINVDFRLICASNRDARMLSEDKNFRFDLYNRVNSLQIHLPPLRERKSDIPLLINYFISNLSSQMNLKTPSITRKALIKLCEFDYPGNVRELKNIIQRLLLFGKKEEIDEEDILLDLGEGSKLDSELVSLDLEEHEKKLIVIALQRSGNVASTAARLLGISPFALGRRLKKYNIRTS